MNKYAVTAIDMVSRASQMMLWATKACEGGLIATSDFAVVWSYWRNLNALADMALQDCMQGKPPSLHVLNVEYENLSDYFARCRQEAAIFRPDHLLNREL